MAYSTSVQSRLWLRKNYGGKWWQCKDLVKRQRINEACDATGQPRQYPETPDPTPEGVETWDIPPEALKSLGAWAQYHKSSIAHMAYIMRPTEDDLFNRVMKWSRNEQDEFLLLHKRLGNKWMRKSVPTKPEKAAQIAKYLNQE